MFALPATHCGHAQGAAAGDLIWSVQTTIEEAVYAVQGVAVPVTGQDRIEMRLVERWETDARGVGVPAIAAERVRARMG